MEKESGMERKLTLENAGRKMHPEKKADIIRWLEECERERKYMRRSQRMGGEKRFLF